MERVAFKMKLFAGREAEYKQRHTDIWPELAELLVAYGIRDYSIWHDPETDILFGTHLKTDKNRLDELFAQTVMKKWFVMQTDIMDTNPDQTPVQIPLNKMFQLD